LVLAAERMDDVGFRIDVAGVRAEISGAIARVSGNRNRGCGNGHAHLEFTQLAEAVAHGSSPHYLLVSPSRPREVGHTGCPRDLLLRPAKSQLPYQDTIGSIVPQTPHLKQ